MRFCLQLLSLLKQIPQDSGQTQGERGLVGTGPDQRRSSLLRGECLSPNRSWTSHAARVRESGNNPQKIEFEQTKNLFRKTDILGRQQGSGSKPHLRSRGSSQFLKGETTKRQRRSPIQSQCYMGRSCWGVSMVTDFQPIRRFCSLVVWTGSRSTN